MTHTALVEHVAARTVSPDVPPATSARLVHRPVVAAFLLAALYLFLSLAMAPAGEVADVGGKLATLHVMDERGTWIPDVGYWAADADPGGTLHPLFFTKHVGNGWAQASTLPMLYAAYPLYEVGGDRAIVLLPILGAVACAFAARALARRLGGGTGWTAFWAIGLATPVAVYALSFWEHTIGLALMAWAMIGLLDIHRGTSRPARALAVGLLFGLAATMRTEALVYGSVSTLVVCVAMALARRWRAACATGIAVLAGLVAVLAANQLLERWAFGEATRNARVAGTASEAVRAVATRLDLATTTATGISGFAVSIDWIVGATAVALVVAGVLLIRDPRHRVLGIGCMVVAGTLYLLRLTNGLGFVPGLLTASPLAAVGLCVVWRRRDQWLFGILACAPVPVVWATQYADTMRPQWGGRYLFTSGLLLAVPGVVSLRTSRAALATAIAAGVVVTALGVAFVVERSLSISDGTASVLSQAPAVVSMDPHFFREAGARYEPAAHWLTAENVAELDRSAEVFARAGDTGFVVVAPTSVKLPPRLGVFVAAPPGRIVTTRPGESLTAIEYHAE